MALVPIFTLRLKQEVVPGLVTVGTYDRKHPSLVSLSCWAVRVRVRCRILTFNGADLWHDGREGLPAQPDARLEALHGRRDLSQHQQEGVWCV